VPDDDFIVARKACEGPKRFADVLREAGARATAAQRAVDAAAKAQRREAEAAARAAAAPQQS
jgi:hypothetical protein